MTMKKKQSSIFYDPSSFMREAGPQISRRNKMHQLNRPRRDNHSTYVDGFSGDHKNGARDFIEKEVEDILQHSAGNAKDNRHSNLQHEHSMAVGEFENGYGDPKDICVNEGNHKLQSLSVDCKKDQSSQSLLEPLNDEHHDKASNSKGVNATEYTSEEESIGKVVAEEKLQSSLESFFAVNVVKHYGLEDSMQESEAKTVTDADRRLLVYPHRPFLNSLNGEGNRVKQPSDQVYSSKAVSKSPDASVEVSPDEGMQTSNVDYNNNIGSGSDTNGKMDIAKDWSVNPADVLNQKDAEGEQFYCHSIGKAHDPSLVYTESVKATDESAHRESPNCTKEEASAQLLRDDHRQFASSGLISNSSGKYDSGESSFSTASLDAHSMAIAFPGNASLRSDSSTTSARSFTFPILQPEWNSSPVGMARTAKKGVHKNKSRKSGLFCCGL